MEKKHIMFKVLLMIILSGGSKLPAQQRIKPGKGGDTTEVKRGIYAVAIPSLLVGTGIIGLENDWLKYLNHKIRSELQKNANGKTALDDVLQYVPMASVYGLNLAGIKGKNNFRDRTMILATSYLMMGITVHGLKNATRVERPDGSRRNSFPSGHTATAFVGAEFLWQEYKEVSPWIGIAGYTLATGTGFFRMYNDRHWLNDVLAGAGIGIVSTKVAYLVYPYIQEKLFGYTRLGNISAMPVYYGEEKGLGCMITFQDISFY